MDVSVLKSGSVFRIADFVVKLYRRSSNPLARLRTPRALRAVHAHRRILPVQSPRPVHWRRLKAGPHESVLVYEYLEGRSLLELWGGGDAAPIAALPRLFAALHTVGALHADLHAKNLIWTGDAWCVLDLDGVRHGLHAIRRRTITENTWARLLFDFNGDEAARDLYREFLRLAGDPWEHGASWARILHRFDEVLRAHLTSGIQPGS